MFSISGKEFHDCLALSAMGSGQENGQCPCLDPKEYWRVRPAAWPMRERFGGWPLLNHTVKSTANLPAESNSSFLTTVFSFFLPHKSEKCKDVL